MWSDSWYEPDGHLRVGQFGFRALRLIECIGFGSLEWLLEKTLNPKFSRRQTLDSESKRPKPLNP